MHNDKSMSTAVVVSLLSNAIALGLVYVLTTIFVTSVFKDKRTWIQGLVAFFSSALVAVCVYAFVYITFGYLPMGHVGPDVLQRMQNFEYQLVQLQQANGVLPQDATLQAPI